MKVDVLQRRGCLALLWCAYVATMAWAKTTEDRKENKLGKTLYVSTSNIWNPSRYALDIKEMREYVEKKDKEGVKVIYNNGKNVYATTEGGNLNLQETVPLRSMSTVLTKEMTTESTFNLYLSAYTSEEEPGKSTFDNFPPSEYAHAVVYDLALLDDQIDYAVDGMVVLHMWMAVAHHLEIAVAVCEGDANGKDTATSSTTSLDFRGTTSVDTAAALWIGEGVDPDRGQHGHSLYQFAEDMGRRFGGGVGGPVSKANAKLIDHFTTAKQTSVFCSTERGAPAHLRFVVDRMLSLMAIPLVQFLIHKIHMEDGVGAELATLALGPLVRPCGEAHFRNLMDTFIDEHSFEPSRTPELLDEIGSLYGCLGITCEDVGTYLGAKGCKDRLPAFAGYLAEDDFLTVETADITYDAATVSQLIAIGADEAALTVYMKGRNSVSKVASSIDLIRGFASHSLHGYGEETEPVDIEGLYQPYFDFFGVNSYADYVMQQILTDRGHYKDLLPNDAKAVLASSVLSTLLTPMAAVRRMQKSVNDCRAHGKFGAVKHWDEAALLLLGGDDGTLLGAARYSGCGTLEGNCITTEQCGTQCLQSLVDRLRMGKIYAGSGACTKLTDTMNDVLSTMQAILFQYAAKAARDRSARPNWSSAAQWHASVLAVAPLIGQVDHDLQERLKNDAYMLFADDFDPTQDFDDVSFVESLLEVIPHIPGLRCDDVKFTTTLQVECDENATDGTMDDDLPPFVVTDDLGKDDMDGEGTDENNDDIPALAEDNDDVVPPDNDQNTTVTMNNSSDINMEPSYTVSIGDGLYSLSSNLEYVLDLSDQVKHMRASTTQENATKHYEQSSGPTETMTALKQLSTDLTYSMRGDRMYSLYRHGFGLDGMTFNFKEQNLSHHDYMDAYGDSVVRHYLDMDKVGVAAEAALILSVWMAAIHPLEGSVCDRKYNQIFMDTAAAMWVGREHDSLYALSKQLEPHFDHANKNNTRHGKEEVNHKILRLLVKLGLEVKSKHCDNFNVRMMVDGIQKLMVIPLIRSWVKHLVERSSPKLIELHTAALVPLMESCHSEVANRWIELAVANEDSFALKNSTYEMIDEMHQYLLPCLRLTCDDVGRYTQAPNGTLPDCRDRAYNTPMVIYKPVEEVYELSRIDLDVQELGFLLLPDLYAENVALDLIKNGHYSRFHKNYYSINSYATTYERNEVAGMFKDYFGHDDYALLEIQNALQGFGNYHGMTPEGIHPAVIGLTLRMALAMAPLMWTKESAESCDLPDKWDRAAALVFGSLTERSMVYPENQYDAMENGVLLYNQILDQCGAFSTCENARMLVDTLRRGRNAAETRDCDGIREEATKVMSLTYATHLQAAVMGLYWTTAQSNSGEASSASTYVAIRAVLPLLHHASPTAASHFDTSMDPTDMSASKVGDFNYTFAIFQNAVPLMSAFVECGHLGRFMEYGDFCSGAGGGISNVVDSLPTAPSSSQNEDTPKSTPDIIPLAGGIYNVTSTKDVYVSAFLNFALDVRDMKATESVSIARDIYEEGKYVASAGNKISNLRQLSVMDGEMMKKDRTYNLYRFAFRSESLSNAQGDFDGEDADYYADALVQDLLGIDKIGMAADATVIVSTWIVVAHYLEDTARLVKAKDLNNALVSLDRAAALWVGDQGTSTTGGYLMFGVTESIAGQFGQKNTDGSGHPMSYVNREILSMMTSTKKMIMNSKEMIAMGNKDEVYYSADAIKRLVQMQISLMTVPLVQHLIAYAQDDSQKKYVELYTVTLAPLVRACSIDSFEYFIDKTVRHLYKLSDKDALLDEFEANYPCLGITCNDVGVFGDSGPGKTCDPVGQTSPLPSGYEPNHDVRLDATIDLDIFQMQLFTENGLYDMALELYTNGYNSLENNAKNYYSLNTFAEFPLQTAFLRQQISPFYDFYNSDAYARNLILQTLEPKENPYSLESDEERAVMVGMLAQKMIMYAYPIRLLDIATEACYDPNTDADKVVHQWDIAAADLTGSGKEGHLLYQVLIDRCEEFSTCEHVEIDNEKSFVGRLRQGQELAILRNCDNLVEVKTALTNLMKVALIQDTIHYAYEMNGEDDERKNVIGAKVAALAVVALVEDADDTRSFPVERMIGETPSWIDVGDMFTAVLPKMDIPCVLVGATEYYGDFCVDDVPTSVVPSGEKNVTDDTPPMNTENESDGEPMNTGTEPDGETEEVDRYELFPFNRYPVDINIWESTSKLAYDVREMARFSTRTAEALKIYKKGTYWNYTLKGMSVDETVNMKDEPLFNMYRSSYIGNKILSGSNLPVDRYADTITTDAFEKFKKLGVESSLVLNLWMYIAHLLTEAVTLCEDKKPCTNNIDQAFSLWIGEEQDEGSEDGWLLYHLTEIIDAAVWGIEKGSSMEDDEESEVNTKLIELFNEARDASRATPLEPGIQPRDLRVVVSEMVSMMTVPLVQQLQYHVMRMDADYTELYALSILPMIDACKPNLHDTLNGFLIEKKFRKEDIVVIIEMLESTYSCFHITCRDVSFYNNTYYEDFYYDYDETNSTLDLDFFDDNYYNRTNPDVRRLTTNWDTCDQYIHPLVGYVPSTDVREFSKIDLDIYQIKTFMEMSSYEAATDIFEHGRNSILGNSKIHSLKQIVSELDKLEDETIPGTEIIYKALDKKHGLFKEFSNAQRALLVSSTLQSMISLQLVPASLNETVKLCMMNEYKKSQVLWDETAAILIGSLEGTERGGMAAPYQGYLFYSAVKQYCSVLGTCDSGLNAQLNEELINMLIDGIEVFHFQKPDCNLLSDIVTDMNNLLLVPFIQGIVHSAITLEVGQTLGSADSMLERSVGFAYANALLAYISNEGSASILQTNLLATDTPLLTDGAEAIIGMLREEIQLMSVDCKMIGTTEEFGDLCPVSNEDSTDVDVDEPIFISQIYVSSSNIGDRHKIAKDVEQMLDALESNNKDLAINIYENGLNAHKYDSDGKRTNQMWNLASFSKDASIVMSSDPIFNFYRHALQDENGNFGLDSVGIYADGIVRSALNNFEVDNTLAVEAIVSLNVWMYVVHKVYSAVQTCKDNAGARNREDGGVHAFDEAAAFWIGDNQLVGDPNQGHLLYALTEKMAEIYDQEIGGQAEVNRKVIALLNEGKDEITSTHACTSKSTSHIRLKHIADELVSHMSRPLLQALLYNMRMDDKERVRLYATSFVPLLEGCNPDAYMQAKRALIDEKYYTSRFTEISQALLKALPCLDLTCADVGTLEGLSCVDPLPNNPIAGYVPSTNVQEISQIDLDILQMRILMKMGAYQAAEDIYVMGKNSRDYSGVGQEYISLYDLASSHKRDIVPQYKLFKNYFNDYNYADTIVSDALAGKLPPYNEASSEQTTEIVVDGLRFMISYMHVLRKMYEAMDMCNGDDPIAAISPWDEAVAIYVGSLEGSNSNGNLERPGLFLFGLANDLCTDFDTCDRGDRQGVASVNSEIFTLFYGGQSEINAQNCKTLERSVAKLLPLMRVALIQNTLKFAIKNDGLKLRSAEGSIGNGHISSNAILPIVNEVSVDAAAVIKDNMVLQYTKKPVHQGHDAVFQAVAEAIADMNDMDCSGIGEIEKKNVCAEGFTVKTPHNSNFVMEITLGIVLALVLMASVIFVSRRFYEKEEKTETSMAETAPLDLAII